MKSYRTKIKLLWAFRKVCGIDFFEWKSFVYNKSFAYFFFSDIKFLFPHDSNIERFFSPRQIRFTATSILLKRLLSLQNRQKPLQKREFKISFPLKFIKIMWPENWKFFFLNFSRKFFFITPLEHITIFHQLFYGCRKTFCTIIIVIK